MRRALPFVLVLAALGGVVAYRVGARGGRNDDAGAIRQTGRTAPVTLSALPAGLKIDGTFRCHELSLGQPPTYTAEATGGTLRNTSGRELSAGFVFQATSGATTESVQNTFTMKTTDTFKQFVMSSKRIPSGLDRCRLSFVLDPPPGFAGARAAPLPADVQALNEAAASSGCAAPQDPKIVSRNHIDPPAKGRYNTTPPTSGDHYSQPAKTGVHRVAIPNEYQVHNLEHGHIGIQYGAISDAVRDQMESIVQADPAWLFSAPYPGARFAVAFTAWGHLVTCPAEAGGLAGVARAFIRAYKDLGPETIAGTPL